MTSKAVKSLLTLGLFVVSTVTLFIVTGCQSSPNDDFHYDEIPMDRRIGTIKSLGGIKTSSQGTHILQLDDGDTIMLKSLAINLDDEKYGKKVVEVRGVLTYTTDSKPLMEVMNIDILDNYVPKAEKEPKWKEYSSEEYGFSMKYRDDYKRSEGSDSVTFTREIEKEEVDSDDTEDSPEDSDDTTKNTEEDTEAKPDVIVVEVAIEARDDEDIVDYLGVESDSSSDLLEEGITKSKIGSNGLSAYKKESDNGAVVTFYIAGSDYFYEITYDSSEAMEPSLSDKNLFFEMLGTLVIFNPDADSIDDSAMSSSEVDEDFMKADDEDTEDDKEDEDSEKEDKADENEEDSDVEPIAIKGYDTFESDSFDFSIQYPKGWYYAGDSSSESGVLRHYEFGDESLEESEGDVKLDVMSGDIPSGSSLVVNGTEVTKVSSGGEVEIYFKGEGSRYYRITGSSSNESILSQMASTIAVLEDKDE